MTNGLIDGHMTLLVLFIGETHADCCLKPVPLPNCLLPLLQAVVKMLEVDRDRSLSAYLNPHSRGNAVGFSQIFNRSGLKG